MGLSCPGEVLTDIVPQPRGAQGHTAMPGCHCQPALPGLTALGTASQPCRKGWNAHLASKTNTALGKRSKGSQKRMKMGIKGLKTHWVLVLQKYLWCVLVCVGVCWGVLVHVGVCWCVLGHVGVCWGVLACHGLVRGSGRAQSGSPCPVLRV